MTNGWTGGQYSVARAVLALALAAAVLSNAVRGDVASVVALLAALFVAAGAFDRWAALLLGVLWAVWIAPWSWADRQSASAVPLLLAWHAAQVRAPFGSWDARGRIDPGGGWRLRPWLRSTAWLLWLFLHLRAYRDAVPDRPSVDLLALATLGLAAVCAAVWWQRRPWPWLVALASHATMVAIGTELSWLDLGLAYLITFDPAWVPRRAPSVIETLFYDGSCGLCHRAVRFLLAEDPDGSAFRFAPLGGETFEARVPPDVRASLPDSLVLLTDDGRVLTRSAAFRHLMGRLGGLWRVLAAALRVVPEGLQDGLYDGIARIRYRLFARPKDACPILPPHLRERFSI